MKLTHEIEEININETLSETNYTINLLRCIHCGLSFERDNLDVCVVLLEKELKRLEKYLEKLDNRTSDLIAFS